MRVMKVSKRIRRLVYELLQACCAECDRGVDAWIHTVAQQLFDGEDIDLFDRDQIIQIAADAFCEADRNHELDWQESYAEAAAMVLEGWSPRADQA